MKHNVRNERQKAVFTTLVALSVLQISNTAIAAPSSEPAPVSPEAAAPADQAPVVENAETSASATQPAPNANASADSGGADQQGSASTNTSSNEAPSAEKAPAPANESQGSTAGTEVVSPSTDASAAPVKAEQVGQGSQTEPKNDNSVSAAASVNGSESPKQSEGPKADTSLEKSLIPAGEKERVSEDAVDVEKSKYRPGKGLQIGSKDGRFNLVTRVRAQMRYTVRSEENENEDGETERETLNRFQIRRARLQFIGHVFNKHNKFKTELAFSPRDLGMKNGNPTRTPLLTWYFEFDYLRDATLRMGQYKLPFSRQRVISSGNLMMVDRALANGEFNVDRDMGFDLRSKDLFGWKKRLRYYAGIYMGEGRDLFEYTDFGLHYLARLEYLPLGNFKDYHESDLKRMKKPGLSFGAAISHIDRAKKNRGILGKTPADGGTTDSTALTADVMFKWAGASLQSEFFWRRGKRNPGDAQVEDDNGNLMNVPEELARNGYGLFVQGGYLIPRIPVEVAARYSFVRPNDKNESSLTAADEVGGAVSWYIAHHPLKLQADYFRGWTDKDMSNNASDTFRIQLQLAF